MGGMLIFFNWFWTWFPHFQVIKSTPIYKAVKERRFVSIGAKSWPSIRFGRISTVSSK
jgi:hypothetical protein